MPVSGGDAPAADPDRPSARATWGPRLVLALWVLAGVGMAALMARRRPEMLGLNSDVYRVAARTLGDVYAAHPEGWPTYRFVYPPLFALAFLPLSALSSLGAHAAVVLASLVAGLVLARALVARLRALGVPLGRLDAALVAVAVVGSVHAVPSLFYGNVNVVLAAALGLGLLWLDAPDVEGAAAGDRGVSTDGGRSSPWRSLALDRLSIPAGVDRQVLAGLALAVPAGTKAFPALFGLWALRRRAWRAVGTVVGVGLLAAVASVAVFGVEAHATYLDRALFDRLAVGTPYPLDAPYVTVRRPLSFVVGPSLRGVLAVAVVLPVVAYVNTRVETVRDRLVALYALVAGILVALPSFFVYAVFLLYPLVPLCYLLRGWPRRVFLVGVAVTAAAVPPESVVDAVPLGPLAPLPSAASPLLLGVGLTLAACVLQRRRRVGRAPTG